MPYTSEQPAGLRPLKVMAIEFIIACWPAETLADILSHPGQSANFATEPALMILLASTRSDLAKRECRGEQRQAQHDPRDIISNQAAMDAV